MKLLVLNPSKESQSQYKMLDFDSILKDLATKVLGSGEKNFNPIIFDERNSRRFVANVEPRIVAISNYSGKPINTFAEGIQYLNEIGSQIYNGKDWKIKVLKTEVLVTKPNKFGLLVPTEEAIAQILTEFDDPTMVEVVVNRSPKTKNEVKPQTNQESEN